MFGRLRKKEKTEESTKKTGAAWKRALGGLFGRGGIDDDFWDELEEALIVVNGEVLDAVVDVAHDEAAAQGFLLMETTVSRTAFAGQELVSILMREQ